MTAIDQQATQRELPVVPQYGAAKLVGTVDPRAIIVRTRTWPPVPGPLEERPGLGLPALLHEHPALQARSRDGRASTGIFGAVWAQAELRKVLSAIGARVVDREIPVATADEVVRDRETLESSGTRALMVGLLAELIGVARERDAIAA